MNIEKSAEAQKRQKQIEKLEKQIKGIRTTVKSLKTRLTNTQSRIQEMHRDLFSQTSSMRERLLQVIQRLDLLAEKLQADKRLNKEGRSLIGEMYRGLVGGIKDNLPDLEPPGPGFDEDEKARANDAFQAFKVEPPREEQREIRKLYLALSKQFHPDLAQSEAERQRYHQLQQQINEAYQRHDIQAMLDLEELWQAPEDEAPRTADSLDAKISRLKQQLDLLKQQKERLSEEIALLRRSEMGDMLTQVDSMERAGYSLEESTGLSELTEMVDLLEKFLAALEDTDRKGRLSPLVNEVMGVVMGNADDMLSLLVNMVGDESGDYDDYDDWDDEYEFNPSPAFRPNSRVRVAVDERMDYIDEEEQEHDFNLRDYSGRVTAALLDEEGDPFYNIQLDTASMKRLPGAYIWNEGPGFHVIEFLEEELLVQEKKKRKEPHQKVQQTYRELLYRNIFRDLPQDQEQRLQDILLAYPAESDELNWLACFDQQLALPFTACTRGLFFEYSRGQKVKIEQYAGFSIEVGITVLAKAGRKRAIIPLADVTGKEHSPLTQLLEDYYEWYKKVL